MRTSENFNIQIIRIDSELLISLQGDLDMYSVSQMQAQIWDYLTADIRTVTIDCDWVQYVDSSFLQLITRLSNHVGELKVINASKTIRKIFTVTGLSKFLASEPSSE